MLFYSLMKANHLVFLNLEIYKERCCDICIYRYFLIIFMPFYLPAVFTCSFICYHFIALDYRIAVKGRTFCKVDDIANLDRTAEILIGDIPVVMGGTSFLIICLFELV